MTSTAERRRATRPDEIHGIFQEMLTAQDIEGILSLYEDGAALVLAPGQVAVGKAAIREGLGPFLAMETRLRFEAPQVTPVGDIALLRAKWTATGTTPDGPVEMAGVTSEVVRRQADGRWLFAVDDPGFDNTAP